VEGNNPHGDYGRVCEGDNVRAGVNNGRVEVKQLCMMDMNLN
jgi:hypothetical protein